MKDNVRNPWPVTAVLAVLVCVVALVAASCTTIPEEESAADPMYIPCETQEDCPMGSECVDFLCIG